MGKSVAEKLIEKHLVSGEMRAGEEIEIKIDQTLTQDATGTMVMLELEAMGIDRVKTELSAQYIDHNIVQNDFKNADDHLFLRSACLKYGIWYSRPGNGVSHPVHMERFGIPGKTLLGSDSHTPAAGSMGMLAIGAGGLEVALAMAGRPYCLRMPKIFGVKLTGELPDWVSAKDIILEMLRRHTVEGGLGHIIEYYGPGLKCLSAMDRHVIANMGAELGATTSVFPSDEEVKRFMTAQGRGDEWVEILPDPDVTYERNDEINLSELEPLIACPSSPGNVVPVREVAGKEVYQVMIGSSANPGYRDFALPAEVIREKVAHDRVSVDINPTSRQILENLIVEGHLENLVRAGARIHQAGCNGCIGMGQAPATQKISLRTVPRNFPGRSGTKEDAVYLCSPETAIAAAITGEITDPRDLGVPYPKVKEPEKVVINTSMLLSPTDIHADIELMKGPNIKELPHFDPLPPALEGPCLIKVGNDVSTDEIMPAGSRVLPFRSNIPEISKFTFAQIDESYYDRTLLHREGGHFVVGGANYGQGSSREHAAIAPRYLGVRAVLVISYARIHWENLINFGILPLEFVRPEDYDDVKQMDQLHIPNLIHCLKEGEPIVVENLTKKRSYQAKHRMSKKEVEMILAGGAINQIKS